MAAKFSAASLRASVLFAYALAASACERDATWPLLCTPGDAIGFKPQSGDPETWTRWDWREGQSFTLTRKGAAPNSAYAIEKADASWSDATCALNSDHKHLVCESEDRRLRLNVETLRFVVASETGYREERNASFDRADVALGKCVSQ